jgi:hypothetical protein
MMSEGLARTLPHCWYLLKNERVITSLLLAVAKVILFSTVPLLTLLETHKSSKPQENPPTHKNGQFIFEWLTSAAALSHHD